MQESCSGCRPPCSISRGRSLSSSARVPCPQSRRSRPSGMPQYDPRRPSSGRGELVSVAQETLHHLTTAGLADVDPDVAALLGKELDRQRGQIELIASENFTWPAVLEAVGSVPTNKYAEGYPGKRYYGGCEIVDEIEQLALDRAQALFGAEHAYVQPDPGAPP